MQCWLNIFFSLFIFLETEAEDKREKGGKLRKAEDWED